MSLATYVSQLGPDGLGHDRCGEAVLASVLLDHGWQSDPYLLMQELVETAGKRDRPTDAGDLVALAQAKGFETRLWYLWPEAIDALAAGHAVLCVGDNSRLRPTAYPNQPGWRAQHWWRVYALVAGGEMAVCEDPLTYLPQPAGPPYQGPTLYTTDSVRSAIEASSVPYAGILVLRGDDAPGEPAAPGTDAEPAP